VSETSIKEEIRSLAAIAAEQERALARETHAHERAQLAKFIAQNEHKIAGLRRELWSSYGK
jgi:hypothetical protein